MSPNLAGSCAAASGIYYALPSRSLRIGSRSDIVNFMKKMLAAALHDLAPTSERRKRQKRGWRKVNDNKNDNKKASATMATLKPPASEMAIGEHETPLDFLLAVMRSRELPLKTRLDAAKSALPYVHGHAGTLERLDAAVDPERSAADIGEDLRRLLIDMGVDTAVIEALVGPTSRHKAGANAPCSASPHVRIVGPR
jgi:hypothetical protein